MPYIKPRPAAVADFSHIVEVVGAKRAALFMGIPEGRMKSLAEGKGRVFRITRDEPSTLEQRAALIESRITRLQYIDPQFPGGVQRKGQPLPSRTYWKETYLPRQMEHIAKLMKGDRTRIRKRHYMARLRFVGMNPDDLPEPLRT